MSPDVSIIETDTTEQVRIRDLGEALGLIDQLLRTMTSLDAEHDGLDALRSTQVVTLAQRVVDLLLDRPLP